MNHRKEKQIKGKIKKPSKIIVGLFAGIVALSSSSLFFTPNISLAEELRRKPNESYLSYTYRKLIMPGKIGKINTVKPSSLKFESTGKRGNDNYKTHFSKKSNLWLYSERNSGDLFLLEDVTNDRYEFIPPNYGPADKEKWEQIKYSDLEKILKSIKRTEFSNNTQHIMSNYDTLAIRLIEPCSNPEGWNSKVLGYGFPARKIKAEKKSQNSYTITGVSSIAYSNSEGNGSDSSSSGAATGGGGHGGGDGAGTR